MSEVSFKTPPMICSICGEPVGQTGVMTVEISTLTNEAGRKELRVQHFRQCRRCTTKPGSGALVSDTHPDGQPATAVKNPDVAQVGAFAGFLVVQPEFKPGRGLATELFKVVAANPRMGTHELVKTLLDSGAYMRVAPGAAKGNNLKPVEITINDWLRKGVIKRNPTDLGQATALKIP